MDKKNKNYHVKNSAGKKYNEKKANKYKAAEKSKVSKVKASKVKGATSRNDGKVIEKKKKEQVESPEVKALKSQINDLDTKINSEEEKLRECKWSMLPEDEELIKNGIEGLKSQRNELNVKLNELEGKLKNAEGKKLPEAGKNKDENGKDSSEVQAENKDEKEKGSENVIYRVGPFKRLLMSIIRKIKSWVKADGRIARLCDRAESAVIGGAIPLLEGATDEKSVKDALNLGKEKDVKPEQSKDKNEHADSHEETEKRNNLADMEFIESKIIEADNDKKAGKEASLMAEIVRQEYKKSLDEYGTDKGFDDKKIDEFVKENNIPLAVKKNIVNITLWNTSKTIIEMAKEKGIAVTEGKDENARPVSEIYSSLEARVKTDRVSEEYGKEERTSFGTNKENSTVKAVKTADDKSESGSKESKKDDELDK